MAITIENLLINREIIEEDTGEKYVSIEIARLKEKLGDGEVKLKSLEINKLNEIMRQTNNEYNMAVRVVYNSVLEPALKDKELQKAYGCKANPFGIVEKIFTPLEIKAIADKVAEISGLKGIDEGALITEIKK